MDIQNRITNISNNLRKLHTRIGSAEQVNKQQLELVRLGCNNLENILRVHFLIVEYSRSG